MPNNKLYINPNNNKAKNALIKLGCTFMSGTITSVSPDLCNWGDLKTYTKNVLFVNGFKGNADAFHKWLCKNKLFSGRMYR